MAQRQSAEHFHVDVLPRKKRRGFRLFVVYSPKVKRPLKARAACISCDSGNAVSQAALVGQSAHNRLWLDAKARPFFIVTPVAHVESFDQLTDEQLAALYTDAVDLLRGDDDDDDDDGFVKLTVNFGCYRNLAHLHLKVKLQPLHFQQMIARGGAARRQQLERIKQLAADPAILHALIGGAGHPHG